MEFSTLSAEEVYREIESVRSSGTRGVRIVFNNGEMLTGTLSPPLLPEAGAVPARIQGAESPAAFAIHPGLASSDYLIQVPVTRVSGVVPLAVEPRELGPDDPALPLVTGSQSSLGSLRDQSIATARRLELTVVGPIRTAAGILAPQASRPIGLGFTADTGVYWDRDYFSDRKGGLNSLGFNAGPLGFSLSWDKSLWSSFRKKLSQVRTPVRDLCANSEVSLTGFTAFLDDREIQNLPEAFRQMEAEGGIWHPAGISEKPLKTSAIGQSFVMGNAALCYFRDECFLFPRTAWGTFSQGISTYGDVTRFGLESGWGAVPCYMKARAGAYLTES